VLINLCETEDNQFQLFEPKGRVLKSPGAGIRFVKKSFQTSKKGFGQQALYILKALFLKDYQNPQSEGSFYNPKSKIHDPKVYLTIRNPRSKIQNVEIRNR
jgi:hypothetical protein